MYVVETDDKPCGLVIICMVIGQSDKTQRRCCRNFWEINYDYDIYWSI